MSNDVLSSESGLLIGTRAALAMCDKIKVGMVGWIDADGEARAREFDSRCRAFGLIWESRWRGKSPEDRVVLLQTRRPGRDWQRGLAYDRQDSPGWRIFWRDEMKERREFSMPPFASLVKIDVSGSETVEMTGRFDAESLEYWVLDAEESAVSPQKTNSTIWLRTNTLAPLRKALLPFFSIKKSRRRSPSITIRHE
jgi:primosomal protein N' (replication factor Y)